MPNIGYSYQILSFLNVNSSPLKYYLSTYLTGIFNSCRCLPEPKRHSSLFLH